MTTAAVDGTALRRRWDAQCDEALRLVQAAHTAAEAEEPPHVVRWFGLQANAIRTLKAVSDGRRALPGEVATNLLHEAPEQLEQARYAAIVTALESLNASWRNGLDAPDWDWSAGYPPGWRGSLGDRLRAGLFYRAR
jgi:hypothetical protein